MKILIEKAVIEQALEVLVELVEKFDYEHFTSVCELDPAKDTILTLRETLADAEKKSSCWRCHGRGWYICGVSDMKRKCDNCKAGKND